MWSWLGTVGRRKCVVAVLFLNILGQVLSVVPSDAIWERQSTDNWVDGPPRHVPKVTKLEVVCGKTRMTVQMEFDRPFNGLVYSKGKQNEHNCVYVRSNSNRAHYVFDVFYDACGTKPDLHGNFYENTVIIQYGSDIIEAWDEAKRLRCEWHEAYEKAAAQPPPIRLADLDVVELNFQGDNIDCWMEIQEGKGPWSREVSGLVPLGSPLTMVIAINDQEGQFDMRVKSCFAHDVYKAPIQLTDEWGCVTRPKMLSPFIKVRDYNGRASVVSYSHFFAFKFPDTMDVHIQCKVEVCRHGCPDSCQKSKYKPLELPEGGESKKPELDHNELNVGHETKQVMVKAGTSRYKTSSTPYLPLPPAFAHTNEAENHRYPSLPLRKKEGIKYVASEIKSNNGQSGIKLTAAKDEDLLSDTLKDLPVYEKEVGVLHKPDLESEDDSKEEILEEDGDQHRGESVKSFQVQNERGEKVDFKRPQDNGPMIKHQHHQDHDHKIKELTTGSIPKDKDFFIHPHPEPEPSFFTPMVNRPQAYPAKVEFPQTHKESASIQREVYALGKNPRLEDSNHHQPRGPIPPASSINLFQQQGHPQPDQSHGRQRFIPPVLYKPPKPHYPYPIPQFVPPQPLFINVAERNDGKGQGSVPQQPQIPQHFRDGHPHVELRNYQPPNGFPAPGTEFVQFQGPRAIRMKRSAADGQEIGVQQVYHAVASVDLAFEPNATSDKDRIYSGRREEIVYGVCLPVTGFAVGLGFLLIITIGSLIVCGYLVYQWRLQTMKQSCKNKLNGLTAKVKNGKLEFFYSRGTMSRK